MTTRDTAAIRISRIVSGLSRTLRMGAGATWPGEIALKISPDILGRIAGNFRKGIILVVGTNGKTTTTAMITRVLTSQGFSVLHNKSGANLLNGIVSTIATSDMDNPDYGVFEIDENSLPIVTRYINPAMVVAINLFRDQLDRYGEVDVIAEKWKKALKTLPPASVIVLNADDPLVASFGKDQDARVVYFGLSEKFKQKRALDHATDSIFCQVCGGRLAYNSYYFSHLGDWYCTQCKEKRPPVDISLWDSPLPGLYNTYNTLAAVLACRQLGIPDHAIRTSLAGFTPAFGRQEEFIVKGKKVKLFLSKNPAGFNASLRAVIEMNPHSMLVALNDRIPDGLDVSWIWDVDFELMPKDIALIASGDRVFDLALRFSYADRVNVITHESLADALQSGLKLTPDNGTLYVLATYSAMLDVRKILTGRKIL